MQKARRHPSWGLRPLVSVRFQVLFHSLIQGTFHLSLTVLVRYRSHRSIQPYRMVPADSRKVSRAPRYSGYYQDLYRLTCTGLSPSMIVLSKTFQFFVQSMSQSYNPKIAVTTLVWANSVSLAATQEITFVFFSSGYLDVSVLRVCFHRGGYQVFNLVGFPIRISTDHSVCATPRSFSQLITSFIASESLGIPQTPLISLS